MTRRQSPFVRTEPRIGLNGAKACSHVDLYGTTLEPLGRDYGSRIKDVSKYTWSGSCLPFRCNVPIGVVTASCSRALVSGPIATPPVGAVLSMREAMLTVSPTIV